MGRILLGTCWLRALGARRDAAAVTDGVHNRNIAWSKVHSFPQPGAVTTGAPGASTAVPTLAPMVAQRLSFEAIWLPWIDRASNEILVAA